MKWSTLFYLKIFAIVISLLTPWICWYIEGPMKALSSYWYSDTWLLFLLTNTITAYYFLTLPGWRISAFFLISLTVFPCEDYVILHDVLAILFFILNAKPITQNKRLYGYFIPYVLSFSVLLFSLFWAEVLAITVLCLYHGHSLVLLKRLKIKQEKIFSYNK